MRKLRISFLHLAPITADIHHNRKLVEAAVKIAAREGADWAITPELCIPGYRFREQVGTDWILPQPDEWMQGFCRLVKHHRLTAFLSHPERDRGTGKLYNSVFVINPEGAIIGAHRKIKVLGGSEARSSPGQTTNPIQCDGMKVGILVCADAYTNEIVQELTDKGAQMLVSPVAWGPGQCAPKGEWEQRTIDTGLPIMVCNRSGLENEGLDYRLAESMVAQNGQRLLSGVSDRSVVFSFDWDMDAMTLLSEDFHRVYL